MVVTREILVYRNLLPVETAPYCRHLERLDAVDRGARFFRAMTDSALVRHCQQITWFTTQIVACFVDGTMRGALEVCRDPDLRKGHAELAISVERPFQGRGIGTDLTQRAVVMARNRLVQRATMLFLSDNARVRSIARRYNAELSTSYGELTADLTLAAPSPVSVLRECWQTLSCYRLGQLRLGLFPSTA
jgi:GNAT superfamily N-acetyltransferase